MKFKKPIFWDLKKPSLTSYLLLPFSIPVIINNFLLSKSKKKKFNIKSICIGNIYLGGTGKTQLSIEIEKILKKLNYKTGFIKKYYKDQKDEQKLLKERSMLFCSKKRVKCIEQAQNEKIDVVIFDDGLQDKNIKYDLTFVCFDLQNWIGNGLLIPAGPLREKISSIKKYDAVFLNGMNKNLEEIKSLIETYNPLIKVFETKYEPKNIEKFNKDSKYVIFSGIGNPKGFINILQNNNINIVETLEFPDHYNYTNNDINKIKNLANRMNAKILTTKKDYMRLDRFDTETIEYLDIELSIPKKNELINFLKNKL